MSSRLVALVVPNPVHTQCLTQLACTIQTSHSPYTYHSTFRAPIGRTAKPGCAEITASLIYATAMLLARVAAPGVLAQLPGLRPPITSIVAHLPATVMRAPRGPLTAVAAAVSSLKWWRRQTPVPGATPPPRPRPSVLAGRTERLNSATTA